VEDKDEHPYLLMAWVSELQEHVSLKELMDFKIK